MIGISVAETAEFLVFLGKFSVVRFWVAPGLEAALVALWGG